MAPGAPGLSEGWAPSNKLGFGTAFDRRSKAWFTLGPSGLTEIYYPRLDTPSVRDLQFIVSDGSSFAEREADATQVVTTVQDDRSLHYQQVETARSGLYRITKTYAVDPARATVLVDVQFNSLSGRPYQLYALLNPGPNNDLLHTRGQTQGTALVASSGPVATAFAADPAFVKTSNGYYGTSDGLLDLSRHYALQWTYPLATRGNVVQTGQTTLDGLTRTHVTLAIGLGADTTAALDNTTVSLGKGFGVVAADYDAGWKNFLAHVKPAPSWLSDHERRLYNSSAMVLVASEDKTETGAFVASPSMPWVNEFIFPTNVYHLVWARDLYQIATGLLAIGDRYAAERALSFLLEKQQKSDGSFPQNSKVDGTPVFGGLQLDEVAFPVVLAWQLQRTDADTFTKHIKPAANFIVANGPNSQQERWEEQDGWSPSTIASEIAGLVCAAAIATRNNDTASATAWLATADAWRRNLASWTVTSTGRLSHNPYYTRLTKDKKPDTGTQYNLGNSGPTVDQRNVADAGFLELTRLGITAPDDTLIKNSLAVVDRAIRVQTPTGTYWHRYSHDGYGEERDGSPWNYSFPAGSEVTFGRLWPLLSGERGEYELLAGLPDRARKRVSDIAAASTSTDLLSEQVWDENPPSNDPHSGFVQGTPTTSATPLAWTHAQYLRLVWSVAAGRPVEQPAVVACRYLGKCTP